MIAGNGVGCHVFIADAVCEKFIHRARSCMENDINGSSFDFLYLIGALATSDSSRSKLRMIAFADRCDLSELSVCAAWPWKIPLSDACSTIFQQGPFLPCHFVCICFMLGLCASDF